MKLIGLAVTTIVHYLHVCICANQTSDQQQWHTQNSKTPHGHTNLLRVPA